jgi:hypothetical protein
MPRNGSGTMSIPNSFSANTTIESAKVNANFSDIASEITGSLARNGESGMTGQFKASDGTAAAPGISFSSDPDSGFYRSASNVISMALAGALVGPVTAFPSGTKLLFQQTAAPTGWTKDTTHNNKALRVVSGTVSSGGTTAFTDVFTARAIGESNLPSHTHTFSGTTSSNGDHSHNYSYTATFFGGGGNAGVQTVSNGNDGAIDLTTTTNGAHTHTYSGTTGATGGAVAMDFAVQYVDVAICTKD